MPSHTPPPRNLNNKTSEYLQRDVSSVEFKDETTSTGLTKVILLDKARRYRAFGYVKNKGNATTVRNELSIEYLAKFSTDFDLRKVGRAKSKIDKD